MYNVTHNSNANCSHYDNSNWVLPLVQRCHITKWILVTKNHCHHCKKLQLPHSMQSMTRPVVNGSVKWPSQQCLHALGETHFGKGTSKSAFNKCSKMQWKLVHLRELLRNCPILHQTSFPSNVPSSEKSRYHNYNMLLCEINVGRFLSYWN